MDRHQRNRASAARTLAGLVRLTVLVSGPAALAGDATSSPSIDAPKSVRLEVQPKEVQLDGKGSRQQLLISEFSPAGRSEDATRRARYRSLDSSVVVAEQDGVVRPVFTGRAHVEVTVGPLRTTVPVTVVRGGAFLPIDFTRDIVPILTKKGCNGGSCHGKSNGRGDFALSLFGYDPEGDYDAVVKSSRGRRIFPALPAESLLLLKPIASVPHVGGRLLSPDDPEYGQLVRWIASGLPGSTPAAAGLLKIEASPAVAVMRPGLQQQLAVTAVYHDGSRRDVTSLAEFRTNDPGLATVDEQGLVSAGNSTGETAAVCLYGGGVAVTRILLPLDGPSGGEAWDAVPRASFIDEHVMSKLRLLNVRPSPVVDDAGFLRRATLQIAGRVPSLDETRTFLSDPNPGKRVRLVTRLAESGESADHFAQKWADILRNKRRKQDDRIPGTLGFHRWIRNAIALNMPYDQFVRAIITASGKASVYPPAQWYAEVRMLDRYVDDTAEVFLGVRIGCARCHNHPFERFTQADYYGLAAFFVRVGRKGGEGIAERRADEVIFVQPTGEVRHPTNGRVVPPHGLDETPVDIAPYDDPRVHLVDWMVHPENPYFSRAFVNRMWAHFFGRGLVEPLDDLRATNPASNEPLLDALANEFVTSRFDMRRVVELIASSTTYQLSSLPNANNLDETRSHSRFYPQRLPAEVLLNAVDAVTGVPTSYSGMPPGTLATQLPDEDASNPFLSVFGRPARETACECERVSKPSLTQAVFLMNHNFILNKITNKEGLAERLANDSRPLDSRVDDLFLTALSRPPTREEAGKALSYLRRQSNLRIGFRDMVWVLINTKEFLYVH